MTDNELDNCYKKINLLEQEIGGLETELEQYRQADESGLLLRLPVSKGTIVYKITTQRDNFDDREYPIIIQVPFRIDLLSCIGKTVFITQKEAEVALVKERQNNDKWR